MSPLNTAAQGAACPFDRSFSCASLLLLRFDSPTTSQPARPCWSLIFIAVRLSWSLPLPRTRPRALATCRFQRPPEQTMVSIKTVFGTSTVRVATRRHTQRGPRSQTPKLILTRRDKQERLSHMDNDYEPSKDPCSSPSSDEEAAPSPAKPSNNRLKSMTCLGSYPMPCKSCARRGHQCEVASIGRLCVLCTRNKQKCAWPGEFGRRSAMWFSSVA